MGIEIFAKHLREKRAISIVSNSSNASDIAMVCRCAQSAKASAVQVEANRNLFEVALKNTKLPVFVSSIHPFKLLEAVKWGVEAITIGGFSKEFSSKEIYDVVLETLALINDYNVFVCVSIPAHIESFQKAILIRKFSVLGVDLIQNEGFKNEENVELLQNSILPFMVSSFDNAKSVYNNFSIGVDAVSVLINAKNSEVAIKTNISEIVSSVFYKNSLNREIIRTQREMLVK